MMEQLVPRLCLKAQATAEAYKQKEVSVSWLTVALFKTILSLSQYIALITT